MATRGRKPVPEHLKLVTDSSKLTKAEREAVLNGLDAQLSGLIRDPPEWFENAHRAEWDYVLKHAPLGLLKTLDYNTLIIHVTAVVAHARAAQLMTVSPMLEETPNGHLQASPYFGIMNRQAEIAIRTASEMGFTPTSRARVSTSGAKDPKDKKNPTSEFF